MQIIFILKNYRFFLLQLVSIPEYYRFTNFNYSNISFPNPVPRANSRVHLSNDGSLFIIQTNKTFSMIFFLDTTNLHD